jgi:hypothetical protein
MRVDTTSRPIDIGADSIKPGRPAHRVEREMLAANPIDHHARDRVDAVVSAAALRTPAMDCDEGGPPRWDAQRVIEERARGGPCSCCMLDWI